MSAEPARAISARCPDCQARIHFHQLPSLGMLLTCPECEAHLEVIRKSPLALDWADEAALAEEMDDGWYEESDVTFEDAEFRDEDEEDW